MKRLLLAAACLAGLAGSVHAQSYPDGPITLVVPYAPGGASDFLGRVLGPGLEKMGQSVIIQNMPGAGTAIGAQAVASAAPDGRTLLLATSTTLAINDALFPDLSYDPATDFTAVNLVAEVPFVLVVPAALGVEDLNGLIALSKERELTYGSAGNGSPHHLFLELLKSKTDLQALHVPYQGSAPAITDLLGGQIDVMMADLAPVLPQLRDGALKALAVSTPERLEMLPDVPTVMEAGVEGYEATAWQGIVGPKGMPEEATQAIDAALREALADPATVERLAEGGLLPLSSTPAEFDTFIDSEISRWAEVVKASGATAN